MWRLGIIGAGHISRTHVQAALEVPDLQVVGIAGRRPDPVSALAAECGAVPCPDLESLLALRPDLVAIGSPSGLHAIHGLAAARRGIHVLTEKPIDSRSDRALALVEGCRAAGVKLGVFFQERTAPDLRKVKAVLESGRAGRPLLVSAQVRWYRSPEYYSASDWHGTRELDGGGVVINQAIHTLDVLPWLVGPVRKVTARSARLLHSLEAEDTAVAILEFANGAVGTFEASTAAYPGLPRRIQISTEQGTLVLEQTRLISADFQGRVELGTFGVAGDREDANQSGPGIARTAGHRAVLEDFIDAISTGRAPLCDGREALKSLALVESIYLSAASGQVVEVAPALGPSAGAARECIP